MILLLVLIASSSFCVTVVQSQTGLQCTAPPKITKVKFSYISYRNQSGQWMSQVGLEHDGSTPSANKTSTMALDVEQSTETTCKGEETISIIANITGRRVPHSRKIPANYELFPGMGHYKFHTQGTSWSSARQICADEGAHLVIINSENEANAMKQLFDKNPKSLMTGSRKDAIWVGIYEAGVSGKYLTIFDEPLASTGFSRWSPGDPNDSGISDCIFLYEGNLGLADVNSCSTLYPFVCEIKVDV